MWLTLGALAAGVLSNVPLLGGSSESLVQKWRLAAEYSCDRAALLVAQDSSVVVSALLKLVSGSSRPLSADAFIDQCREYDEALAQASPMIKASLRMQNDQRTHPLPVSTIDITSNTLVRSGPARRRAGPLGEKPPVRAHRRQWKNRRGSNAEEPLTRSPLIK